MNAPVEFLTGDDGQPVVHLAITEHAIGGVIAYRDLEEAHAWAEEQAGVVVTLPVAIDCRSET